MPFAGYDSFADCVADNQDKDDPEAFCAWLHYRAKGEWPGASKGGETVPRSVNDSIEAKLESLHQKVREAFNREDEFAVGLAYTFNDAVVLRDYENEKLYEVPYAVVDEEIVFGEPKEAETVVILKRIMQENPDMSAKEVMKALDMDGAEKGAELTGPIVMKDDAEQVAFAAVLVPGEPDRDFQRGEKILTKEEVERVANQWLADYGNIDLLHSLNNVATPVQSYTTYSEREVEDITTGEKMVLPEGTWILGSKLDDDAWDKVQKGELTGYSVMGIKRAALKSLLASMKSDKDVDFDASLKRTLIRDLGDDWVAPFVSVVDTPCVPKAKWFAIKSAPEEPAGDDPVEKDAQGLIAKVLQSLGVSGASKAGRRISEERYQKLTELKEAHDNEGNMLKELLAEAEAERQADKSGKEDDEMNKEEVKAMVDEAIKEAIGGDSLKEVVKSQLDESLGDIKNKLANLEEPEGDTGDGDGGDTDGGDGGDDTGGEDLQSEILKRIEKLEKRNTGSRAIKGQDGDGDSATKSSEVDEDRDIYGRKRKGVKK